MSCGLRYIETVGDGDQVTPWWVSIIKSSTWYRIISRWVINQNEINFWNDQIEAWFQIVIWCTKIKGDYRYGDKVAFTTKSQDVVVNASILERIHFTATFAYQVKYFIVDIDGTSSLTRGEEAQGLTSFWWKVPMMEVVDWKDDSYKGCEEPALAVSLLNRRSASLVWHQWKGRETGRKVFTLLDRCEKRESVMWLIVLCKDYGLNQSSWLWKRMK